MKSFQMRISDSLYKELKNFADEREVTLAEVVRRSLESYLHYDLKKGAKDESNSASR